MRFLWFILVMPDTLSSFSTAELRITQIQNVIYVEKKTLGTYFIIMIFVISNMDMVCGIRKPTQVSLSNLKVHEHTLTLKPRLISFVCDACGTKGDLAPYVCLQCDFIVQRDCASLPRVIHVTRISSIMLVDKDLTYCAFYPWKSLLSFNIPRPT